MLKKLKARFKEWRRKRKWNTELQLHHVRMMVQSDNRWMAHSPIVSELTERYLRGLADNWESQPQEDVSQFRTRMGLDPNTRATDPGVRAAASNVETGDELDDDHPLWLINEQIKGLLEGDGAPEDHEDVLTFLRATGLPEGTVNRVHRAIVFGDTKVRPTPSALADRPAARLPCDVMDFSSRVCEYGTKGCIRLHNFKGR